MKPDMGCMSREGELAETVSLLPPEGSQARTSCGELRSGEGGDCLNTIQPRMEGIQFQAARARRAESLCFIWSEQDTCIIAVLQE